MADQGYRAALAYGGKKDAFAPFCGQGLQMNQPMCGNVCNTKFA
jgi:hypothetical protein